MPRMKRVNQGRFYDDTNKRPYRLINDLNTKLCHVICLMYKSFDALTNSFVKLQDLFWYFAYFQSMFSFYFSI